jgi:putative tricarboxylic transport membrane protein
MNEPGEGGGIAFKDVATLKDVSDPLIVAASPSTLLGLAQHHFGTFTENDVRWIAAVDAEPGIIAVSATAKWKDLKEFVTAWRANPDSIVIAGTGAIGGQDHMKMLLLARKAGIDVRRVVYRPVGSPAEAIALMQSGRVQVFPAELSKMLPQVERKELRVIAVLSEQRAGGRLANVPTAREQGYDVVFMIWRGFYAPRGISDGAYQEWVNTLRNMTVSAEWKSLLEKNGLSPFFVGGPDFETFVAKETAAYRTVSRDIGLAGIQ